MEGKFACESSLTGTVQTGDEHHSWISLDIDVLRARAHEIREFVVHDLDHHLLRLHSGQHIRSDSLVLHTVAEILGYFIAHVSIQQGLADFLDGLGDIYLGDFTFTLQYLERPLQPFA